MPIIASLLLSASLSAAAPKRTPCRMAAADRAWLARSLAHWRVAERDLLRLPPTPLPPVVAIDARCRYAPAGRGWRGTPHAERTVTLPDGKQVPVGPISFAAPATAGEGTAYFAMSLPSVWRAAGVTSELGLEKLMDGVMLHEIMHTRQAYFANPALDRLSKANGLGDDFSDDSLQARFKTDPAYVAAYEAERDRLYAAAAAPTDAEARKLAGEALALMRERRARWFTGKDAYWAEADDIFVQMEGLGQWVAYAWYVSPGGGSLPKPQAVDAVRRKRTWWTQDEGLALMLVVDRLAPGWQKQAFAPKPALAEALLALAAAESPPSPAGH